MGSGKSSVLLLAQVRRFHVYLAMLAAPTLIFFSATGMLQLFSLHEAHGDYHPPVLLQRLAALHKDQVFSLHHPHPQGAASPAGASDHAPMAPASSVPAPTDTHADADADDDHHDGDDAAPAAASADPADGAHHHGDRAGRHQHADDAPVTAQGDTAAPGAAKPEAGGSKLDKTAHWTAPQIALKSVLAVTSCAALISILLGVWMGFVTCGKKRLPIACFALGLIAPLVLIFMVAG